MSQDIIVILQYMPSLLLPISDCSNGCGAVDLLLSTADDEME